MYKRGQITLFIVLGIVILLVLGILFFFGFEKKERLELSTRAVEQFVEGCLEQVGAEALQLVGVQGGYIYPVEFPGYYQLDGFAVHYNYYAGANLLPTAEEIASIQIDTYMALQLNDCLQDLEVFPGSKEVGNPLVTTEVKQDSVDMVLNYPVRVHKGDTSVELSEFSHTFLVRLGRILDLVNLIIEQEIEDPNFVDLTLLEDIAQEEQIVTTVYIIDGDRNIHQFIDAESTLKTRPYVFFSGNIFADSVKPDLFTIPNQEVQLGETLTVPLQAWDFDGDDITFSVEDGRFTVVENFLRFTPSSIGAFEVTVLATDSTGLVDQETMKVNVI